MIISYKKRTFCFYPNIQLHSSVGSFLKANQRGPLMFAVVYRRRLLHQAPRSVCSLSLLTLPPPFPPIILSSFADIWLVVGYTPR